MREVGSVLKRNRWFVRKTLRKALDALRRNAGFRLSLALEEMAKRCAPPAPLLSHELLAQWVGGDAGRFRYPLFFYPRLLNHLDHRIRTSPSARWSPAAEKLLGQLPDAEIARRLGRGVKTVSYRRQQLGMPVFNPIPRWTPEEDSLLRTLSTEEAASRLGRTAAAIEGRRGKLHIPKPHPRRRPWTPAEDNLLGTKPDTEVARQLGRNTNVVGRRRRALGLASPYKKRRWTARELALLDSLSGVEAAARLGRSIRAVYGMRSRQAADRRASPS